MSPGRSDEAVSERRPVSAARRAIAPRRRSVPPVGTGERAALAGLAAEQTRRCVIAYEPLWAIGTGKAATPADANHVIGLTIRGNIAEVFGGATAQAVRVQYGGSVNADNIAAVMAMPEVDDALAGGVSLKPDFVELVRQARLARQSPIRASATGGIQSGRSPLTAAKVCAPFYKLREQWLALAATSTGRLLRYCGAAFEDEPQSHVRMRKNA